MVKKSFETISNEISADPELYETIIKTLLYFDIFNYPLNKEEIFSFLGKSTPKEKLFLSLQKLSDGKFIYQFNEFYSIQNKVENVVKRIRGNEGAQKMLPLARKKANFIGKFPFVRSVMASGSLSKGYMDENSDLDFFIITAPERLWIARMLLVIYKRLFLFNSHKHFCINYFIASDCMEIDEKNQFTATELATVIPLYGQLFYHDLIRNNGWIIGFFPNYIPRPASMIREKDKFVKRLLERFFNLAGGKKLDELCLKATYNRWVRIYRAQYSDDDFRIAFKSEKSSSKNHPKNYQKKVIDMLDEKWTLYKGKFNLEEI